MRCSVPALLTLATVAALAGCGGDDSSGGGTSGSDGVASTTQSSSSSSATDNQPPEVRETVVQFLSDVDAGQMDKACKVLAANVVTTARNNTLSTLQPPEGTGEEQMAFILKANKDSKGCPGTLKLIASQKTVDFAALKAAAQDAKVAEGTKDDSWSLGGQEWVVTRSGDAWKITATTAF